MNPQHDIIQGLKEGTFIMSHDTLAYNTGFGNEFATESLDGALPDGQNSPQKGRYDLYAEQISGTPFTAPQKDNLRTWFYRINPSVKQKPFEPYEQNHIAGTPFSDNHAAPNQMRWDPPKKAKEDIDFIDGIKTIAGNGDLYSWSGLALHIYTAGNSMSPQRRFFYNADGELLIVPQEGCLELRTEMGVIHADPGEIAVIPRGIKFAADFPGGHGRGYICENYGRPFTLPDRGPIGANGLANPRDFRYPVAAYENDDKNSTLIAKFGGRLWKTELPHHPLDVVAWHGNYAPYKYNLAHFQVINTVSFDHPDPSIFTVLTSPSTPAGTANIDFAIFPPRWNVAENTFRPPYFHRNIMSEFMGLIHGVYEGKEKGGFAPGGYSLHNCMSPHGPDTKTFLKAREETLKPVYLKQALAFMFESRYILKPTEYAAKSKDLQDDYHTAWQDLPKLFTTD